MGTIYLALLHYPVYNKKYQIITTTITNLDLHDIARASLTYGIKRYYVLNPLVSQQDMVKRMYNYWVSDFGAQYNPSRMEAFTLLTVLPSLKDAKEDIRVGEGVYPKLITTDARPRSNSISYHHMREILLDEPGPFLLLFGTGWGLAEEVLIEGDYFLEPIYGCTDYNHLSVRSAVSIILDRLLVNKGES